MRNDLHPLAASTLQVLAIGGLLVGIMGGIGNLTMGGCERMYLGDGEDSWAYGQTVQASCNTPPVIVEKSKSSTGEYLDLRVEADWSSRTGGAARWLAGGVAVFAGALVAARKLDPPSERWRREHGEPDPTVPAP